MPTPAGAQLEAYYAWMLSAMVYALPDLMDQEELPYRIEEIEDVVRSPGKLDAYTSSFQYYQANGGKMDYPEFENRLMHRLQGMQSPPMDKAMELVNEIQRKHEEAR